MFEDSQEAGHSLLVSPANAGIKLRGRAHCMVRVFRFFCTLSVGGGLLLTIGRMSCRPYGRKNIMQPHQGRTTADNCFLGIQFKTETMVSELRPIKNGLSFHNPLMRRAAQFRSRHLGPCESGLSITIALAFYPAFSAFLHEGFLTCPPSFIRSQRFLRPHKIHGKISRSYQSIFARHR